MLISPRPRQFAQPILEHLRGLVHRSLPGVEETIKWSMPHYMLGGKNLAGMAGFKAHCAFTIHGEGRQGPNGGRCRNWHGPIRQDHHAGRSARRSGDDRTAPRRARSRCHERQRDQRPVARAPKPELPVPDELASALAANTVAQAQFDAFTPRRAANTTNGSARPKRPPRANAGWPRRSNGSPRARSATGSTKTAEAGYLTTPRYVI